MESKGNGKSEGTYVRPLWPDDLVLDPGSSEEIEAPVVEGIEPQPTKGSLDEMSRSFQALCREMAQRRKSLDNDQRQLQIDRAEQKRLHRENEQQLAKLEQLRSDLAEWELRLKAMQAEQAARFERRSGEINDRRVELEKRSEKLWQKMTDLNDLVDVVNQVVTDEYGKLNEKGEHIESLTKKLVDAGEVSRAKMLAMGDATERRLSRLKRMRTLLTEKSQEVAKRERMTETREVYVAKQAKEHTQQASVNHVHANDELSIALRNVCRAAVVLISIVLVVGVVGAGAWLWSQKNAPPLWRASLVMMFNTGGESLLSDQMDYLKNEQVLESTFQRLAERGIRVDESQMSSRMSLAAQSDKLIALNYLDEDKEAARIVVDALARSLAEHNQKSEIKSRVVQAAVSDRQPMTDDRLKHASVASGVATIVMVLFWIAVWKIARSRSAVNSPAA